MNVLLGLILGFILLFFTFGLHEYIHYVTLKIKGYDGKFLIHKSTHHIIGKIPFLRYNPAIKPIGVRENFICAIDAQIFLLTPVFPTILLFIICFYLFDNRFTIVECICGTALGLLGCSSDIKRVYLIQKWWITKNKNLIKIFEGG